MAVLIPFRGIRPKKELAVKIASRPYDVLNEKEAREECKGNPFSFYHIIKPEIDFQDSMDHYKDRLHLRKAPSVATHD